MNPSDVEIVLLRPGEVLIDRDNDVQRSLRTAYAESIARDYDPNLFGMGYVSLRADGKYYVLDGQHRCAAAVIAGRGEDRVPFIVLRGLSVREEAEMFRALNKHKLKVDALSLFKCGVVAKDPVHLDIVRVLNSFGLTYGGESQDGTIAAVATLLQIYHGKVGIKQPAGTRQKNKNVPALPKAHLLSRTLQALTQAWGTDRNAFDGLLLRGVAAFIYKHDTSVDGGRLAKLLARHESPLRAAGQIRSLATISKITSSAAAVQYFESVWNRKLDEDKRLK